MANQWEYVTVMCPYFLGTGRQSIVCEGSVDRCNIRNEFTYKIDKQLHKENYCNSDYEKCRIWQMLEGKYDEHGNKKN